MCLYCFSFSFVFLPCPFHLLFDLSSCCPHLIFLSFNHFPLCHFFFVFTPRPLTCLFFLLAMFCFLPLSVTFAFNIRPCWRLPPLYRVWEVTTGEVLNTLIHHNEAVLHLRFANGLMVTCSKDRSIAVWDMASPTDISLRRVLVGHRAAVNVVDFDDKYIVSASGDRTIKVTTVREMFLYKSFHLSFSFTEILSIW